IWKGACWGKGGKVGGGVFVKKKRGSDDGGAGWGECEKVRSWRKGAVGRSERDAGGAGNTTGRVGVGGIELASSDSSVGDPGGAAAVWEARSELPALTLSSVRPVLRSDRAWPGYGIDCVVRD